MRKARSPLSLCACLLMAAAATRTHGKPCGWMGDGCTASAERAAYSGGALRQVDVRDLFKELDVNNDGTIELSDQAPQPTPF